MEQGIYKYMKNGLENDISPIYKSYGALKQEVLAFIARLKSSHEVNTLTSRRRQEFTTVLKRLGTKFILGTMAAEEVVELLCALEAALRSGLQKEIDLVYNEVLLKLDQTEQSVQGEVCAIRPKKAKKAQTTR